MVVSFVHNVHPLLYNLRMTNGSQDEKVIYQMILWPLLVHLTIELMFFSKLRIKRRNTLETRIRYKNSWRLMGAEVVVSQTGTDQKK